MHYSTETIAIVPARSGSKSVTHKNIKSFSGKPLMAHSIEQGLASGVVRRVLVSTDSPEYAEIARHYGAEVPFLRPAEISGDFSTDLECFQHALRWFLKNEGAIPEIVVHLRPTHPNRKAADIARAVELLRSRPDWDSLRSVVPSPDTPFKMWYRMPDGNLEPVVTLDTPEAHSLPRQKLPPTYLQNASIDVIRSKTIMELGSIAGNRIGSLLMEEIHDIDTESQFRKAEDAFAWASGLPKGKTFVFDIDGVIASLVPGNDYSKAKPLTSNIHRINRLFDAGNTIVLLTARGSATGLNWGDTTKKQMLEWGVKHHQLLFGKPAADHYVDDKMLSLVSLAALDEVP